MQVYADSQLIASIVSSTGCSRARRMYVLRTIMNAMGNSARHTGLYFKFQAVLSLDMDLILEAGGGCGGCGWIERHCRRFRSRRGCFCSGIRTR